MSSRRCCRTNLPQLNVPASICRWTTDFLHGLIYDWDEADYRLEIDHLVSLYSQNNLVLNALKTVVVDLIKDLHPSPCSTP